MTGALRAALDRLAPREVHLEPAAPGVVHDVVAWVAQTGRATATWRAEDSSGVGDLLVTSDPDRALRAAADVAVLFAGERAVAWPSTTNVTTLGELAVLVEPVLDDPRARSRDRANAGERRVEIVVPVHGAPDELRRCLAALARHTTVPTRLLLVDDASADVETAELLADVANWSTVELLRNSTNMGFTASVNRGLRATSEDVVVLNSDTEVGPRWLERLLATAARDRRIGTVTAVSDNAGAFSVPVIGQANPLPPVLDVASAARIVARATGGLAPDTPTANGFCMLVRRAMLDDVGLLDETAFPRGYGEENDLCMRAGRRGWRHVVDTGTFVHHVREASFGGAKQALARAGRDVIDARHPDYTAAVRTFVADPAMADARRRIAAALAAPGDNVPRVLFVIHEGGGGTPVANAELMRALEGRVEALLLTCDRRTIRLDRFAGGGRVPLRNWELEKPVRVMDFTRDDYRAAVTEVLDEHAIDLVHVRHLFKHTFDVPAAARSRGIPVVFSFHDFYFACPSVNLLDDHDHYCAGRCTDGDGACRVPPAGLDGLPHLKHAFVHQWREEVDAMLRGVDAFVTTSAHTRNVHRDALAIGERPFHVIAHGRDLRQTGPAGTAPVPGGPVRLLFVGNLEVHKGGDYLRQMLQEDVHGRLELHFLGDVPDRYGDLGRVHGRFAPDELIARVRDIAPSMLIIPSICAETFSHSLTEAWAMGVPAVVTNLGALAERVVEHGGGWLIPADDASAAVRQILAVADDPPSYEAEAHRADLRDVPHANEMADGYAAVYAEVLDSRRALAPTAGVPAIISRGTCRLTAIVAGADGVHPGSAYVRVVQRYRHPRVAARVSTRVRLASDGAIPDDADVVLVQRTALPPDLVPALLAEVSARRLPLIMDLDDHLLASTDRGYTEHREALALLLGAADLVLVSTPRLQTEIAPLCAATALVPNALDERLFLDGGVTAAPGGADPSDERIRIAYVGSPTHADDLMLLQPVFAELDRREPGRFVLDVVGVQDASIDAAWFERTPVRSADKPYPRFVRWLRTQRPRWTAAVAPLADTPFNACKSDLKWLEYTALGLPVVASRSPAYATVRDGVTGRTVPPEPTAWADALQRIADDADHASGLVGAAWDEVIGTRLLRHQADEVIEMMLALHRSSI